MNLVNEYNGIKVETCQTCGTRDGIHLEEEEVTAPHLKKVICRHCHSEAPESGEIHAAIVLWNRLQVEKKLQLSLFPAPETKPESACA